MITDTKLVSVKLIFVVVLLDENMVAHVSDFGISKLLGEGDDSLIQTKTMATIGYMAPGKFSIFKLCSLLFQEHANFWSIIMIRLLVWYLFHKKNAEFESEGIVSTKYDVYSYGILLLETFSRKKPTDDMFTGEISLKHWVNQSLPHKLAEVVDSNLVRQEHSFSAKMDCLLTITHLALNCCME